MADWQVGVAAFLGALGFFLSVWAIVYMRHVGKGNPMDALGHEVAPRTQHLMTGGPYRINRNPMLTGVIVYGFGVCVLLWKWEAFVLFVVFVGLMMFQVHSEEERLRRDFGEEYEAYCNRTGRFLPISWERFKGLFSKKK